jgi:hypothetical protein
MANLELICPRCGVELAVDASQAGHRLRCEACHGAFRVPAEPQTAGTSREWEQVRSGLGLVCVGGLVLLSAVILLATALIVIAITQGPEALNPQDEPSVGKAILFMLGSCGFMLSMVVGVGLAASGGMRTLAVPKESGARGWLAASLACLVVGGLALTAAFIGLIAIANRPDGTLTGDSLFRFIGAAGLVAMLLLVLSFLAYARFLVQLALCLGEADLAQSARTYGLLLAVCILLAPLATCVISLVASDEGHEGLVSRFAALVVMGLFLGWWLVLVSRLRLRLPR